MTEQARRFPAIRTVMMPADTNYMGNIFGGRILSLLDLAAAQHAKSVAARKFVTKVMREVNFIAPVYVGDTVSYYTETATIGRTSITVRVDVEAERKMQRDNAVQVTTAEVVLVAVDEEGRPVSIY